MSTEASAPGVPGMPGRSSVPGEETTVIPPLEADPVFIEAVDEAVLGDVLADAPEAQPERELHAISDFSSLYVRYRTSLAMHARRFLNDQRDIDEVVQETFLRLFLAIPEIETELQAIAFARRTLTNLCIDRYRADRRRPRLINLDDSVVYDITDDADFDDPLLRAEDAAIVREALALLSPLHRAALVKREVEEKPLPQIAAELDIPEESVKHLLFRARRALRRLLVGTSVEPGADLDALEIIGIANRRAGHALLRGANVLVILFVGVLIAAVGLRPHGNGASTHQIIDEGGAPVAGSGDRAVPPATTQTRTGGATRNGTAPQSGSHPGGTSVPGGANTKTALGGGSTKTPALGGGSRSTPAGTQHGTSGSPTTPPATTSQSSPAPTLAPAPPPAPPAAGQPPAGSSSTYTLNGPLEVRSAPTVQAVDTTQAASGTSVSRFEAATSEGTFTLTQAVVKTDGTAAGVAVQPSFTIGNTVAHPTLTGASETVTAGPDGTTIVNVREGAQPDPSTNLFPLTSLDVYLVLSPNLNHVVSESVTLGSAPSTAPSGSDGSGTAGEQSP